MDSTIAPDDEEVAGNQPSKPSFSSQELKDAELKSVGRSPRDTQPAGNPSDPRGDHDPQTTPLGDKSDPRGEPSNAAKTTPHENQVGAGFTPDKVITTLGPRAWVSRNRRPLIGGGIIGGIVGLVAFFSFLSGPLQEVQLAKILEGDFSGSQNTASVRLKGLFRYARTGETGETRVSLLGSKIFHNAEGQLADIGITFDTNGISGAPTSMIIDTNQDPDYSDLAPADREAAIIKDYVITDPSIISEQKALGSGIFKIDLDPTSIKGVNLTSALLKTSLAKLDDGKIVTAINFREMKVYYNLPRLLHPLEYLKKPAENGVAAKLTADEDEETREEDVVPPESPDTQTAVAKVKGALEENKDAIGGLLLAGAALCVVKNTADSAILLNHELVVVPSTIQAVDKIAIGNQIESGQDFDASQLGPISANFTDSNGQTIWQAQALQATEGQPDPNGVNLPHEYGQAFSDETTASNIDNSINVSFAGINFTGLLCSKTGLVIQGVTGLAVLASGLFDLGSSWGAYVATSTAEAAAAAGAFAFLHQELGNLLDNKAVVPSILSGPLGGNLLAFGAREAANINARSTGGTAEPGTDSDTGNSLTDAAGQAQFQSQNIAYKLFDPYDSRTVISKFIDNVSPSPTQNFAKMGTMLLHFGDLPSIISSLFTRHTLADAQPYNWGFPTYGISNSLAENPAYENPYANADYVATLLDKNGNGEPDYITRAANCFGDSITKVDGDWDVTPIPNSDIDPNGATYLSSDCNDQSSNWQRIQLFVSDTREMNAIACYAGNDSDPDIAQACSDEDMSSDTTSGGSSGSTTGTTTTPPSSTTTNGITINSQAAQNVAQQSGATVGFALYNSSGQALAEYNDTTANENYGASITKAMVLVAYLNDVGSNTLSSYAESNLTGMIEQSNDTDANNVIGLLGGAVPGGDGNIAYSDVDWGKVSTKINSVATQAGMQGFKYNDTADSVYWLGQSQITAQDFAKLFSTIDTMFPANQKAFALNLLSSISPDAGLLQAGLPGTVYSKEGWKPEPGTVDDSSESGTTDPFGLEGAPYIVNQAAQFSAGGQTYGVAVTVGGTASQAAGETIVQNIVSALIQTQ